MKKIPLKPTRKGFTLVELLIVIVIIAALAALGMTAAVRMLRNSKASKCVNNLRQLGLLVHDIRTEGIDNGFNTAGFFPPYAGAIEYDNRQVDFNIYELIGEKAQYCVLDSQGFTWSVHPSETVLQNPLSERDLCELIREPSAITNANFTSAGGFGYNSLIEGEVTISTPAGEVRRTNMSKVDFTGLTILMAEQNPNNTGDPIWLGPEGMAYPAGTYKQSAHCLMVDGTVKLIANKVLASAAGMEKHLYLDAGRGDTPDIP